MTGKDWQERVDRLSPAHGVALRLHAAGHPDQVVAEALGVPSESVAVLLHVARAKLSEPDVSPTIDCETPPIAEA